MSHAFNFTMAVLLIAWVSISLVLCLALVRAAARGYVRQSRVTLTESSSIGAARKREFKRHQGVVLTAAS